MVIRMFGSSRPEPLGRTNIGLFAMSFLVVWCWLASTAGAQTVPVVTDLTVGGGSSQANAVNASGQVVGWYTLTGGAQHAFSWQAGIMVDLGTLGGGLADYSQAYALNDSGQVVGYSSVGAVVHAF